MLPESIHYCVRHGAEAEVFTLCAAHTVHEIPVWCWLKDTEEVPGACEFVRVEMKVPEGRSSEVRGNERRSF